MKRLICFLIGHKIIYLLNIKEPIDISNPRYIVTSIVDCIFCSRCGYKIYGK